MGSRMNIIKFTLLIIILAKFGFVGAAPVAKDSQPSNLDFPEIKYIGSLSRESQLAFREGKVLLLYVSRPNCPYCEKLKNDVLFPLIRGGRFDEKMILREISLNDGSVAGFDNKLATANEILANYEIVGTPTLLFLGENGHELTEKLSGYFSKDFYWSYFENAINRAYKKLRDLSS